MKRCFTVMLLLVLAGPAFCQDFSHRLLSADLTEDGVMTLTIRAPNGSLPVTVNSRIHFMSRLAPAMVFVSGAVADSLEPGSPGGIWDGYFPVPVDSANGVQYPDILISNRTVGTDSTTAEFVVQYWHKDMSNLPDPVGFSYVFVVPNQPRSKWFFSSTPRPSFTPGKNVVWTAECILGHNFLIRANTGMYDIAVDYWNTDTASWAPFHVFGTTDTRAGYGINPVFFTAETDTSLATDGQTQITVYYTENGFLGDKAEEITGGPFPGPNILSVCQ